MPGTLTPAFDRFPKEASITGRLLSGYAELDFQFGLCAERALRKTQHPGYPDGVEHAADNRHVALKALYRLRSESGRIQVGDALARSEYVYLGLEGPYACAVGAIRHCLTIRNQFAHCHWHTDPVAGLIFTDLEENAKGAGEFTFEFKWRQIDLDLLQKQELYFEYAMRCLEFVHGEFMVSAKMAKSHHYTKPSAVAQPPLYNRPAGREPPSLDPTE